MLQAIKFLLFISLAVFLVMTVNISLSFMDQSLENREMYETISIVGVGIIMFNAVFIMIGGAWAAYKASKALDDYFKQ